MMSEVTVDYDAFYSLLGHTQTGGLTPVVALIPNPKNDKYNPKRAYIKSGHELEEFARKYDGKAQCYIGLNPVRSDIESDADHTNDDVTHICNILIDVDPEKSDSTISDKEIKKYAATDSEKDKAVKDTDVIAGMLKENNFTFYRDDSGNGNRIILAIEPILLTPENRLRIKELLKAVQYHIQEETKIKIDAKVHDFRRITGIPGTRNLKKETETRKNRMRIPASPIPHRLECSNFREFIFSLGNENKTTWSIEHADLPEGLTPSPDLTDEQVISLLMGSKLADSFEALYDGILSEYGHDASVCDYHFCKQIAFYTQKPNQIERIARRSDLVRDKWDREDGYFRKTISVAINKLTSTYQRGPDPLKDIDIAADRKEAEGRIVPSGSTIPKIDIDFLKTYIGPDNVVCRFMDYCAATTNGYPEYAHQVILFLLSLVARRRLLLELTVGKFYSNVWVLNFGLSTVSRKSTISRMGLDILEGSGLDLLLPNDFTPEALVSEMASKVIYEKPTKGGGTETKEIVNINGKKNATKGMSRDEYSSFVAAMGKSYNQSLRETLCHFYDCPPEYNRKLRREHFFVEDVYLAIQANTTIAAFSAAIDMKDFDSGWLPRHLIVNPTYQRPSKRIGKLPEDKVKERCILSDFLRELDIALGSNVVHVDITEEALDYWNEWIENWENSLESSQDEVDAIIFGRYSAYALKLAMLYELGKPTNKLVNGLNGLNGLNQINSLIISLDSVYCAIYLIDALYIPYFKEVKELLDMNQLKNSISSTLSVMKKYGTLSRSDLLTKTNLSAEDLDKAVNTLYQRDQLLIDRDQDNSKKPKVTYTLLMRKDEIKRRLKSPRPPSLYKDAQKKNNALIESEDFSREVIPVKGINSIIPINQINPINGISPEKDDHNHCVECGSSEIYGTSDDGKRCKACYDIYSNPPPVVIPDEFSLEDPAEVTP